VSVSSGIRACLGIQGAALTIALAAAAAGTPAGAAGRDACDERCLDEIGGEYLDSLTANDSGDVPLSPALRSTENGVELPVTAGIWTTATGWAYRHTFVDPLTGGIGIYGVVHEARDQDAMVAIRLKVAGRQIVESERIVTRRGDFALFDPEGLTQVSPLFTRVEPVESRSTRADLEKTAHDYFGALAAGEPRLVAMHPDAYRIENGVRTTDNPPRFGLSVREGIRRSVYIASHHQFRTPVIDVRRGLVWAVLSADMPAVDRTIQVRGKPVVVAAKDHALPRSMWLFELFKVVDGQIVAIETVMRNEPLGADMGWGDPGR
jgi:hypothetical protein